jgi:hypothetical protein
MTDILDVFIKEQYKEISDLDDDILISEYCDTISVKKQLNKIKQTLREYNISHVNCCKIARKLLIIPPGTKSHIRGCKFNKIISQEIKKIIKRLKLNVELTIEKKHNLFHEIPDWIISNNKKILVGYNQISLFGGGHQLNRGSKYILDDALHTKLSKYKIKMVCVVKDLPKTRQGKSYNILLKGIKTKRLYCIRGIKNLMKEYFC